MTDFSPLDSALHESTPEKIAASLRYLRKADAVMAALMPLSANPQAPPAAVAEGVQRHPMYVGMRNRLTSELVRRFELAGNEFARAKAEALVSEYQSALAAALAAKGAKP